MVNYYLEFLNIVKDLEKSQEKPRLLLHSCCAPCSSASLEAVLPYFKVDVFYYNPNITDKAEYLHRVSEQTSFLSRAHSEVELLEGDYEPEKFYQIAKGLEDLPECGLRCFKCYRLRLEKTAEKAKELGYDYFASTLSVSPYKKSDKLNEIGFEISESVGIKYLPTDFKKNNGYKRSIELSHEYGLYRQNYCGCEFSKAQREAKEQK